MDTILVTGGAGYIASHTIIELLKEEYRVVVLDNFCNSNKVAIERVQRLSGKSVEVVDADIRDTELLKTLLFDYEVSAVFHFAGLKSVAESISKPIEYYDNNVGGTISLLKAMDVAKVRNLVFSSSATVYGSNPVSPVTEDLEIGTPSNPYGWTKLVVERILFDIAKSNSEWSLAILRYFNPVGAHSSGLIGEDPLGLPNNLVPYMTRVAAGLLPELSVFGVDYPTRDGSGVRDYIHVTDLSEAHVLALKYIMGTTGVRVWNLGTGKGYSVLEVLEAFENVVGRAIPVNIQPRRPGDVAECWANPIKAELELGWKAKKDIKDMLADSWNWQKLNPNGFKP